eukprot:m51a1_g5919 putative protein kinase domain containing protein (1564) ;mRNA; f:47322-56625
MMKPCGCCGASARRGVVLVRALSYAAAVLTLVRSAWLFAMLSHLLGRYFVGFPGAIDAVLSLSCAFLSALSPRGVRYLVPAIVLLVLSSAVALACVGVVGGLLLPMTMEPSGRVSAMLEHTRAVFIAWCVVAVIIVPVQISPVVFAVWSLVVARRSRPDKADSLDELPSSVSPQPGSSPDTAEPVFGTACLVAALVLVLFVVVSAGIATKREGAAATGPCEGLCDTCALPWPSSRFVTNGAVRVPEKALRGLRDGTRMPTRAINEHDGFSVTGPILFELRAGRLAFDRSGTHTTLPLLVPNRVFEPNCTLVVDADTNEVVPHWAEIDRDADDLVVIQPAVPLRHAPGYTAILQGKDTERLDYMTRMVFPHLSQAGWDYRTAQLAWDFPTYSESSSLGRMHLIRKQTESVNLKYHIIKAQKNMKPSRCSPSPDRHRAVPVRALSYAAAALVLVRSAWLFALLTRLLGRYFVGLPAAADAVLSLSCAFLSALSPRGARFLVPAVVLLALSSALVLACVRVVRDALLPMSVEPSGRVSATLEGTRASFVAWCVAAVLVLPVQASPLACALWSLVVDRRARRPRGLRGDPVNVAPSDISPLLPSVQDTTEPETLSSGQSPSLEHARRRTGLRGFVTNGAVRVPETALRGLRDGTRMPTRAINEHDGFSVTGPILFELRAGRLAFDRSGTHTTLPLLVPNRVFEPNCTLVVDADTNEVVPHWAEIDRDADDLVVIQPAVPLRHAPGYTAILQGKDTERLDYMTRMVFPHLSQAGWDYRTAQLAWDFPTYSESSSLGRMHLIRKQTENVDLEYHIIKSYVNADVALRTVRYAMASDPHLMVGDTVLIDANKTGLYGISQGGILGGGYFGYSAQHPRAVLSVPGSSFALILLRSNLFKAYQTLLELEFSSRKDLRIAFGLFQAESAGWLNTIKREQRHVLIQSARGDGCVSELACHLMARGVNASTVYQQGRPLFGIPERNGTLLSLCSPISYLATAGLRSSRLSFWRGGNGSLWRRHAADWVTDNYADGHTCDCMCGAWDPDCSAASAGPVSPACNETGSVCSPFGLCTNPRWDSDRCDPKSYGSGDGCQCGCGGLLDPDCRSSSAAGEWYPRALNCPGVARCSDSGQCVQAWSPSACPPGLFGDGAVCNCMCQSGTHVLDPDCTGPAVLPSDCGSGSSCLQGSCRSVPQSWTCSVSQYGSGDGCHCNCGAYDPGCQDNDTEQSSDECDGGDGCTDHCTCAAGWIPSTPRGSRCIPKCGDGVLVGPEQCDGGAFCSRDCTCPSGHSALSPPQRFCSGCGNEHLDPREQCDGGAGCVNCACTQGYQPATPLALGCARDPRHADNTSSSRPSIAVMVGVPVGSAVLLAASVCAALAIVLRRRLRQGPGSSDSTERSPPGSAVMLGTRVGAAACDVATAFTNVAPAYSGSDSEGQAESPEGQAAPLAPPSASVSMMEASSQASGGVGDPAVMYPFSPVVLQPPPVQLPLELPPLLLSLPPCNAPPPPPEEGPESALGQCDGAEGRETVLTDVGPPQCAARKESRCCQTASSTYADASDDVVLSSCSENDYED